MPWLKYLIRENGPWDFNNIIKYLSGTLFNQEMGHTYGTY